MYKNDKIELDLNTLKLQIGKSRKLLQEYKMILPAALPSELFEMTIGLLLGDASLQTQDNGKTYRIKFEYGDRNFEYAKHLYEKFIHWILSPPRIQDRINSNGVTVRTWCFQTISHSAFVPLANIFLDTNHKKHIIPSLIQDYLTPRGLAYWYMDDGGKADYGNRTQKGMLLHTHGFNEHEVLILCDGRRNKKKFIIFILRSICFFN